MKYLVTLGGRTLEVVVDGERVEVEGKVFEAHLSPIPGTPLRHLLLGPESYTLAMERADSGWAAAFRGERHVIEVLVSLEAMKMENELRATSAGVVQTIAVEPGQVVERGSVLVEFAAPAT